MNVRYTPSVVVFLCAFFFASAQTKTWQEWQADFDNKIFGSYSYDNQSGLSKDVAAALKSHSGHDMYFEGFTIILGLTKAWQATGDFKYLDLALDLVQSDCEGAVDLQEYYQRFPNGPSNELGSFDVRNHPFRGNVGHQNYWEWKFGYNYPTDGNFSYFTDTDKAEYLQNAPDNPPFDQYSYGNMIVAGNNGEPGIYYHLQTSIYYRFAADLIRIMWNNRDKNNFLDLTSNNGQTYRQRLEIIRDYLETQFVEYWGEYPQANISAYWYRVNTHMSSHNASIALGLYVVTGKQKYLDWVNQYLYNWGEDPESDRPDGVGFLDQLRIEDGGYYWANNWGNRNSYTDIGHAHAELHFLTQCIEEGIGLNPPNAEPAIDEDFISRISEMMQEGVMRGYTCEDGSNTPQIKYFLNGTGSNDGFTGGSALWGMFSREVLCYQENNDRFGLDETGIRGASIYAARVQGIAGAPPPVYPSNGEEGSTNPANSRPNVILNGESEIDLDQGDDYNELGAIWSDFEDGSGTLNGPTVGQVDTQTAGTYVLEYSYTDTGGLTDTAIRTVNVSIPGNDCPVVSSNAGTFVRIALGDTYQEQGGNWTDTEDGSGTATVEGDQVNTNQVGTYTVVYSYTDAAGCRATANLVVEVFDDSDFVFIQSFNWDNDNLTLNVGDVTLPPFTIAPSNPTIPFIWVQSSNNAIATTDENGYLIALQPGTITVTGTTLDGSNLTDTIEVTITDNDIYLQSFSWDDDVFTLEVGETALPPFTIFPTNATTPFIWIQSSNESVANVDGNGLITGLQEGTVIITGSSLDGSNLTDTIILNIVEERLPQVSSSAQSGNEGDNISFDIRLSESYSQTITLNVSVRNGTTSPNDWAISTTQLVFAPGETNKIVDIQAIRDGLSEMDEVFYLQIEGVEPDGIFEGMLEYQGTILGDLGGPQNLEGLVSVFPNPATAGGIINIDGLPDNSYSLTIYSLSGRQVFQTMRDASSNQLSLSLPDLNKGMYIIRMTSIAVDYSHKLLVN